MTMKEICSKFLSLLHYVPYIIDEKPKIQHFLSCLPLMFKERIEYNNLKTMEEALRKANFCYDQNKNKQENISNWKNKIHDNFEKKNKGNKFYKNTRNNYRGYQGNNFKNYKYQNPAAIK